MSAGRIAVMVTQGGRTYPALVVDVQEGEYHVGCLLRVGQEPEISVRLVSYPSWLDRLSRWFQGSF